MSVAALLNKTCTINTSLWQQDTVTFERTPASPSSVTVACKVDVLTDEELGRPSIAGKTAYDVYLPFGTAVKVSDEITKITGMSNIKLSVESDPQDDVGRGWYIRVRCQHITGGINR